MLLITTTTTTTINNQRRLILILFRSSFFSSVHHHHHFYHYSKGQQYRQWNLLLLSLKKSINHRRNKFLLYNNNSYKFSSNNFNNNNFYLNYKNMSSFNNNNNNVIKTMKKHQQKQQQQTSITHVIFDLDGLLLDTEFTYELAAQRIVQRYGREFLLEDKLKILGRPGSVVAKMIVDDLKLPITVTEFMKQFDREYHCIVQQQPVPLMPGAERLIRHLYRSHIPTAIATGSRRLVYDMNTKYHKKLFELFHHVLMTPEDPEITKGKPDPQPYLVCAKRFCDNQNQIQQSLNNNNILVFEDSLVGIESANRAGMTTVWIPDYRIDRNKYDVHKQFTSATSSTSKSWTKPSLILDSLKLFQPELFGLPPFLDD